MLCPSCGTPVPDGARFCPACGHGVVAARGDERRLVTVLFGDLVGYTTLAASRDPERVKNLVDRCFERLAADVVAYGGRVDKIVGDAIMALFGAPLAHEDDAERAVRAGLQMQRTLAAWSSEHAVDIRMRVGVNSGEVLVGALRAGGDYTAMGDVVNIASRLQTAAQPGQVLVGPTTHVATRSVLRYESLGPVQARGREEPVPAWVAVAAVAPPGYRPRRVRTPLIGRNAELGILRHGLELADDRRRAHLVVLTGEAGTGKTRLAEEIASVARFERHAHCLEGRCVPYGETNVWWPLAEALRRSCGITPADDHATSKAKGLAATSRLLELPPDDRELQRIMNGLVYLMNPGELTDLEPGRARDEAVRSMAICLERMTATRPLVFILSELHWADDLLLEFLDRLLDRLQNLPILLVATARPELADRWHPPAGRHNQILIHVDPLDAKATAELLGELVVSTPSPELRDALVERSGGNPLFLEELVALTAGDHSIDELPVTLRGLVAARLDALDPVYRSTLEDAAVVGRTGSPDALKAMAVPAQDGLVDEALAALAATDLISISDSGQGCQSWEFRAEVVREVAYSTLTKAERARRHARFAEWLATRVDDRPGGEELDELAHHFGTAASLVIELGGIAGMPVDTAAKAIFWIERAAGRAESEGLWPATASLLDDALSLSEHAPAETRERLVAARARARIELRDIDGARADLSEVFARASAGADRSLEARSLVLRGQLEHVEGRLDEAVATLRQAVDLGRAADDEKAVADALKCLGQTLLFTGDDAGADAASVEALALYRTLGDRGGEAWALQHLAWTAFMRGDLGPAEDHLRASAQTFTEIGDWGGYAWAVGLLGWVRYSQGRLDEARDVAERLLKDQADTGDRWAIGMMTVLLANVSLWSGATDDAVRHAAAARELFVDVRDPWAESQALVPLTRGLIAVGRIGEARELLDDMRDRLDELTDERMHRIIEGVVVIARTQQLGEGPAVVDLASGMIGEDPDAAAPEQRAVVGLALLQSGRVGDALLLLERALDEDTPPGPTANIASMVAFGLLAEGRADQAADLLARCVPPGVGTYADQCWAAVARAFAAQQRDDPVSSDQAFAEAVAVADATGDQVMQATVRLAHRIALEGRTAGSAAEVVREVEQRLLALGVGLTGWATVFSLAARSMTPGLEVSAG